MKGIYFFKEEVDDLLVEKDAMVAAFCFKRGNGKKSILHAIFMQRGDETIRITLDSLIFR